jgi:hypothetical protein
MRGFLGVLDLIGAALLFIPRIVVMLVVELLGWVIIVLSPRERFAIIPCFFSKCVRFIMCGQQI